MKMDQNTWILFFAGLALASALFALGVALYPQLRDRTQGYPFEAAIEAALLPLIFDGICAAYRLSEQGVDDLERRLQGADKKKIADSIYSMLPDQVGKFDISLVKRVVSKERFEQLVQDAFDRFDRFFLEHRTHFDDLFKVWKQENKPAARVPSTTEQPQLVVVG
jgi:hypothetical protein